MDVWMYGYDEWAATGLGLSVGLWVIRVGWDRCMDVWMCMDG